MEAPKLVEVSIDSRLRGGQGGAADRGGSKVSLGASRSDDSAKG